jgi:tRNA nucleotidyltransferase (CCA-adding enzyme)
MEAELRENLSGPTVPSDASLRTWAAAAGRTRLASVLRLAAARWSAERDAGIAAPPGQAVKSAYRRAVRIAYRDAIEVSDLAVNGRDLEKIGLVGPLVGQTLRKLLELVITDPAANSRTGLMETAQSFLDQVRAGNSGP